MFSYTDATLLTLLKIEKMFRNMYKSWASPVWQDLSSTFGILPSQVKPYYAPLPLVPPAMLSKNEWTVKDIFSSDFHCSSHVISRLVSNVL